MATHRFRILVAGAGAVGSYYGGRLAAAGEEITFLARGEQLAALNRDGLTIESIDGDARIASVTAVAAPPAEPVDLVVLAVKAYQTDAMLETIAPAVGPGTLVLSLQNGLDNEDKIAARFGPERTVGGIAFIGSERTSPGRVRHTAAGHVAIGAWDPASAERVAEFAAAFRAAGIRTRLSPDIRWDLWHKILWNAAFNTTTCLAGRTSTELLAVPEGEALVRAAMAEIRTVAAADGVGLGPDHADEYVERTRGMGDVRTSMLVDRERGRRLEVEAISGAVVRRADTHGIAVPVQRALYALLKTYDAYVEAAPAPPAR